MGILTILYIMFFGLYTMLWLFEYWGWASNPVDGFISLLTNWMEAFERLDFLGYPIRLGKLFIRNLEINDKFGLNDYWFGFIFFVLFYPIVFEIYQFFSVPLLLYMPSLMVLYYFDRDMFVVGEPNPISDTVHADVTYKAREGIPFLLTRFYRLSNLLIFNIGTIVEDAIHGPDGPPNSD